MNLCTAILLSLWSVVQLAEANSKDSSLKESIPVDVDVFGNYEEMEAYYMKNSNREFIKNPTEDTYVSAYNLHHEEIASGTKHRMSKRSDPEYIKFDLSDAKEPDDATKEFYNKFRENAERSLNASVIIGKWSSTPINNSTSETKTMPVLTKRSIQGHKPSVNIDNLPNSSEGIENLVKIILKERPEIPKLTKSRLPPHSHFFYNDFFKKSRKPVLYNPESSQKNRASSGNNGPKFIYKPKWLTTYEYFLDPSILKSSEFLPSRNSKSFGSNKFQGSIPDIGHNHYTTPTLPVLVKVIPEIEHAIKEVSAPSLKVLEPISHQHLSGAITPQTQIGSHRYGFVMMKPIPELEHQQHHLDEMSHANLVEFRKQIIKEHPVQPNNEQLVQVVNEPNVKTPLNVLYNSNYGALTSLVGKSPSDQLDGLTYILEKGIRQNKLPQESTAPIVFHPVQDKTAQNVHVAHVGGINNYNPEGEKDFSGSDTIKPITENFEMDIKNAAKVSSPVVHITPPPVAFSYKNVDTTGLSPNYAGLASDNDQLRYASRYTFGYRVRDFHSGNDFGHKQNRDVDGVTTGQYHILLPDGRIQNVIYRADKSGFHADVSFETGHH